ncbi:MAG: hypothetical protein AAGH19_04155 [Pseudomonadota bacterium]
MTRTALRRWLPRAGNALAGAAIVYVLIGLWGQREALGDWEPTPATLAFVAGAMALYAAANQFLAISWHRLLGLFDVTRTLSFSSARSIYARSQMAKYLPGNVLHLASRHVLLRERGYGHTVLLATAIHEMAGLMAAASLIAVLAFTILGIVLASLGVWTLLLPIAVAGAFLVGHRLIIRFGWLPELPTATSSQMMELRLASVLLSYLGFFVLAGLALTLVARGIGGPLLGHAMTTSFVVFAISWMAGFLTPGAPSGIGVREAVIVTLLDGVFPPAQALLMALVFRGVTVLGDLLFLALSALRNGESVGDA